MEAAEPATSQALDRAQPLLLPEARPKPLHAPSGYLDLIGGELPSTGFAQDLMLTRIVPVVYERWWRPALGRIAKGVRGPSMADEHRIARLLLGLLPGHGVLDVACGPGNFSRDFARAVGAAGLVVGIDASPTMLARAVETARSQGLENLAFMRANAIELPFRDSSFDAVCCFGALHLFADPFRALDRMAAVLTPGGRIALLTTVRGRTKTVRAVESLLVSRQGMHLFAEEELHNALAERGFTDIRQRTTGVTQIVGAQLGTGSDGGQAAAG